MAVSLIEIASLDRERIEAVAQILIQVKQLAAFALPAHPSAFAGIENAVTVKKIESAEGQGTIFLIESIDQFNRQIDTPVCFAYRFGAYPEDR